MQTITTTYQGVEFEVTLSEGESRTWDHPGEGPQIEFLAAIGIEDKSTALDHFDPTGSLLEGRFSDQYGEELDEALLEQAEQTIGGDADFEAHVLEQV